MYLKKFKFFNERALNFLIIQKITKLENIICFLNVENELGFKLANLFRHGINFMSRFLNKEH